MCGVKKDQLITVVQERPALYDVTKKHKSNPGLFTFFAIYMVFLFLPLLNKNNACTTTPIQVEGLYPIVLAGY